MKRRALLAAVGTGFVAVSGCTADDSGSDDGATPADATERSTGSDGNEEDADGDDSADTGETGDASDGNGTDDPSDADGTDDPSDAGGTGDSPDGDGTGDGLDDPSTGDRQQYEECSREVVQYENLPTDLQAEVDAALDGPYAVDDIVLKEAMDVEESYVSVDDRFYRPAVTDTSSGEILTLERVEPKAFPDPRPVTIGQFRASDLTITLEAVAENGDVLLDETRTLAPETEVEVGSLHRAGVHDVYVTVEKAGTVVDEVTGSSRIDVSHRTVDVTVAEEISVGGGVAYVIPCDYDADQ